MSEVDLCLRVGETWLNHIWGVLVLDVAPHPPANMRVTYERSAINYTLAAMPHAWCLVLYDDMKSWNPGETRWLDVLYILGRCKLAARSET